jgi:UDP-N-acetylglucosamine--N-acetylmuramyl-(pentapeptide) pyrophosphoryl-undecaprenol N-acetylglucosamine transferase
MIVAGGGTGGHLFPGLAVAEALAESDAALFVGSSGGIEARVIPRTRFPFRALEVRGVRGRGWRGIADFVLQIPRALRDADRELAAFEADVVLGVGGYASFPAVVTAWLRGIPTVLLEQNARPGMANRVLGRIATRVCTSFAAAGTSFPSGRVVVTGNPVRAFAATAPVPGAAAGGSFHLLVFGGSQGAQSLNAAMSAAAPRLAASIAGLRVTHQTGRGAVDAVRAAYESAGVPAEVLEFIDDMGAAYAAADLVVCRSGATTLAELASVGKAAILIPYPKAADDHQRANAEVVEAAGAARMILDAELDAERLAGEIEAIAASPERRAAMQRASRSLAKPDAAEQVVRLCRQLVESGSGGES